MKRKYFIFGILAAAALVWSCTVQDTPEQDPEVQKAIRGAEQKSMEVIDLLVEAKATGNFEVISRFLGEEDPDGEISALIKQYGKGPDAQAPGYIKGDGWTPAEPTIDDFKDGNVVLFIGNGTSWQNQIMSLIYRCEYHHAGVFDEELADLTGDTAFISSTIDTGVNGLCYQTLSELKYTSGVITRLAYFEEEPAAIGLSVDYYRSYTESVPTLYAFLHLNLNPVSRWNPFLWYCSKVPWRVYWDGMNFDIENNNYYELSDPNGRWTENRDTPFYQLYLAVLKRLLPRWARRWAGYLADQKLCSILYELITPDELRYASDIIIDVGEWRAPGF
ncbi:MAG: hypothetical protein JXQ30_14570 [Spirochaetes bacterium]|nr:hypothetical protein [Spirochaetota bacterium]